MSFDEHEQELAFPEQVDELQLVIGYTCMTLGYMLSMINPFI